MSEGKYVDGAYIPWTAELILEEADAEAGPSCCDESYQKLRAIMAAAPDLLEALEWSLSAMIAYAVQFDEHNRTIEQIERDGMLPAQIIRARSVIARARGLSQ